MSDEKKPVRCGCGGEPYLKYDDGAYSVMCTKCRIETSGYCDHFDNFESAKAYAIRDWNTAMGTNTRKLLEVLVHDATDTNVGCKFDKDIDVPAKETVIIEPFTTDMSHVGYCKCGYLVNVEWKYCPLCGARLEWK